jgi:hypothetical protein
MNRPWYSAGSSLQSRAAGGEVEPGGLVLLGRPADAEARDGATAADQVDRGPRPGQLHGRVERRDLQVGAERHPLGRARRDAEQDERIGGAVVFDGDRVADAPGTDLGVDRRDVPVAHPEAVRTGLLDLGGKVRRPVDLMRQHVQVRQHEPDFHRFTPV